MKVRSLIFSMLCLLAMGTAVTACSDDDANDFLDDTGSKVTLPQTRMYILNEGNWGSNNAGIAFYDPNGDAPFVNDLFKLQNEIGLGDIAQSVIEYDDEVYAAVYGSNYLVKMNAALVEQKRVSFVGDDDLQVGIRYIVADDGYIYASFYDGIVAKINATTLVVENKLTGLGERLENLVICDDMLYVANSCSSDYITQFTEVKVIDLNTFTLKETLTVAQNPNRVMLEEDDKVFLVSDDYTSAEGYVLQMIEPSRNNHVTKIGNASHVAAYHGVLYCVNSITDYSTNKTTNAFFTYNIQTGSVSNTSFLKNVPASLAEGIVYMIEINESNGEIYLSTTDYINNGTIYRFRRDGTFMESFDAGGFNPSQAIFFN